MTSIAQRASKDRGQWAENYACNFLCQQGLQLLEKNYRCRWGEIDLIMGDGPVVAFVEVRYRSASRFGTGADSITHAKCQRIIRTAEHYLQKHDKDNDMTCRFDVVSIGPNQTRGETTWLKNAFQA